MFQMSSKRNAAKKATESKLNSMHPQIFPNMKPPRSFSMDKLNSYSNQSKPTKPRMGGQIIPSGATLSVQNKKDLKNNFYGSPI